jgi:hypothetical protein
VLKYVSARRQIASATIMRRDRGEGKRFFFEKKEAKNFYSCALTLYPTR